MVYFCEEGKDESEIDFILVKDVLIDYGHSSKVEIR